MKNTQSGKNCQLVVYVCAVVLGVLVAYVVINTTHGASSSSRSFSDAFERGSDWFAHHRLAAAGRLQQAGRQKSAGQEKLLAKQNPDEESWLGRLDRTGCEATEELRICSHRARTVEMADVFSGSLSAYPALWKAKVK